MERESLRLVVEVLVVSWVYAWSSGRYVEMLKGWVEESEKENANNL